MFSVFGALLLAVLLAPNSSPRRALDHHRARRPEHADRRRLESLRAGIDQAHDSMIAFNTPRGWLSLVLGHDHLRPQSTPTSCWPATWPCAPSGSTHLFVDLLLIQTLVSSILYFAPTPGGAGVAELLSPW